MIVCWDTSALMKLYVTETHSGWAQAIAARAAARVTAEITWVEMCAALAFKARAGQIEADAVAPVIEELRSTWPGMHLVAVDRALVQAAGDLALRFSLRAYDSVQLATAWRTHQAVGTVLAFCCFDRRLSEAARQLGLNVLSPGP